MLVIEDPNTVAGGAFKLLFAAYYKMEGVSRRRELPPLRARWSQAPSKPRPEWAGQYALPAPQEAKTAPTVLLRPDYSVVRQDVRDSQHVYVLHTAPGADQFTVDTRDAAVAKARTFAARQGVRV